MEAPRTRRNILESMALSWLLPMFLMRLASRLLSISTFSNDFRTDIQLFITNPLINSTTQSLTNGTVIHSSLFDKVHFIILNEIQSRSWATNWLNTDFINKSLTILTVCFYAILKSLYFTFTMVFALVCFMLTMKRKMGGFGGLVCAVVGR